MCKMYNKLGKIVFSWNFVVIPFLINLQNIQIVLCSDSDVNLDSVALPPLDLIQKQSDTCGQLEIIPSDTRTFAPWSVAIYRYVGKDQWEFHTSGTIFGTGLVVSVQAGQQGRFPSDKNPRNFFIAAGINTTDFSSHDQFAQYSRVSLIEPLILASNVYVHPVVYHLDQPLDIKNTPFVREICFPFFASHTRFQNNLANAVQNSLRFEYIQFGFALPSTSRSRAKNEKNLNGGKTERKLKLWSTISLPQKNCDTIFRFYYGKSIAIPRCFVRNVEDMRGFYPLLKILDKLKVSDSEVTVEEELGCLGPGSLNMLHFGNSWFLGATVWLVPSMKTLRCNSKTVYFGGLQKREEYELWAQFFYSVIKCPPGKFSCKNPQKCINIQQTCDKKSDCDDSSDEDPILCEWKTQKNSLRLRKTGVQSDSKIQGKLNDNSNSNWTTQIEPRDLNKKCPSLLFTTEGVRCRDSITLQILDCQAPFFTGRKILVDCDDYHFAPKFTTESKDIFCNFDGEWSGLESIVCHKKCGIRKTGSGFSWDAAIFISGVHACGASLIQDNFVISHANCIKSRIEFPGKHDFHVFIRPVSSNYQENLRSNFTHATRIKDVWISVNDLEDKYESGIALIKLETPVLINRKDSPMAVCSLIPPFSKLSPGKMGEISAGFRQQENIANFKAASEQECDRILNGRSINNKTEFCATSNQDPAKGKENKGEILQGSGLNFVKETTRKTAVENLGFSLLGIASKIQDGRAVFLEVNSFSYWIVDILEVNS